MREVIREDLNKGKVTSLETVNVRQLVISLIIIVLIIISIFALFYYLFFQQSIDRVVAGQYRRWAGSVASPTDWNIKSDNDIDSNKVNDLKEDILGNELLKDLRNFEQDIPLEPVGKNNPFIPWSGPADEQFVLPIEEEELEEIIIPLLEDTELENLEDVLNESEAEENEIPSL